MDELNSKNEITRIQANPLIRPYVKHFWSCGVGCNIKHLKEASAVRCVEGLLSRFRKENIEKRVSFKKRKEVLELRRWFILNLYLNNSMTQKKLAKTFYVSCGRISQIIIKEIAKRKHVKLMGCA